MWNATEGRRRRIDGVLRRNLPSGRAAMIERMRAIMEAAEAAAPRIVPADEAIAEDLQRRHGERTLLIEARPRGDGSVHMLAVLDLEREALAAEAQRFAAAVESGAPAVEVVDRATWACVQRVQAIGMLQRVEGPVRVLHRARELGEVQVGGAPPEAVAPTLAA